MTAPSNQNKWVFNKNYSFTHSTNIYTASVNWMHSLGCGVWRRNKGSLWWKATYGFKGWWLWNVTPCSCSSILGPTPHTLPRNLLCDNPSVLGSLLSVSSVSVVLKYLCMWADSRDVCMHVHSHAGLCSCVYVCGGQGQHGAYFFNHFLQCPWAWSSSIQLYGLPPGVFLPLPPWPALYCVLTSKILTLTLRVRKPASYKRPSVDPPPHTLWWSTQHTFRNMKQFFWTPANISISPYSSSSIKRVELDIILAFRGLLSF